MDDIGKSSMWSRQTIGFVILVQLFAFYFFPIKDGLSLKSQDVWQNGT